MGSESMAEWAIDSDAMRTRGTIFFSKIQVVGKKYREKNNFSHQNAIQPPLCWFSKPVLFATRRL